MAYTLFQSQAGFVPHAFIFGMILSLVGLGKSGLVVFAPRLGLPPLGALLDVRTTTN